ncbi:uncharacterized protein [Spinacia oleracea]|uniref:DUF4283 domain-containing protein n=1 Tax=Spinacia oleracea TaxID=3562 RepID=A0ABM3QL31_SPIOL|nr:uncharacterized protein LOC110779331 [Spinacia oleracea]XP_056684065.1 uncharacterized protein LOC110779331 [Spinacia oleracea]XP_056684066.1 uncharacterized protein LOC110779331 [Spinacia oleracea]XP_056684067.1 uncharacterized protein LOC110779331 [Spinacia oleracea]
MIQRWNEKFHKKPTVQAPTLAKLEFFLTTNECGDEFKRAFVVYVLGVFLAPTSNRLLDIKVLKAVEDVSQIVKQCWCKYVLHHLGSAVERWKESAKNDKVGGCLLFLEITYLQRSLFRGVVPPKEIPLVQHWNDEQVTERLVPEEKMGFGVTFVDITSYPVSKTFDDLLGGLNPIKLEVPEAPAAPAASAKPSECAPDNSQADRSRIIEFHIPESLQTDAEIQDTCDDVSRDYVHIYFCCIVFFNESCYFLRF